MNAAYLALEEDFSTEESLLRDITYYETQISKLRLSSGDEHRRMLIVYRSLLDDLNRRFFEARVTAPRVKVMARNEPRATTRH